MLKTVPLPIAALFGRLCGPRSLGAPVVALGLALAAWPAVADSDYPPGLFENSPVVGPGASSGAGAAAKSSPATPSGSPGVAAASGRSDPSAGAEPPVYAAPYGPYGVGAPPPDAVAPVPPAAIAAPPYDYCAGIATRTFGNLEEVRRAHARCDRAYNAPPPGYQPPY
jgi:hypothetical protein